MERNLIRELQDGNLEALGDLYEQHQALVYRTALAVTRDERAAEDILQECFVSLYRYARTVDPERPLKPWLYRVTVNLAYDWLSRTRWTRSVDDLLEWLSGVSSVFPAPERRAEDEETAKLVHEVIAGLSAPHRAVVVLFYLENQSVEEIARILELPEGTVKSRLYYARERLKATLTRRQRPVPELTYEFT